jgi:hypothetical protein
MKNRLAMTTFVAACALWLATLAVAASQSAYDPATESSVSGVIRYVISTAGADGTVGVHLELKTPEGPVRVHLAPAVFIGMNNFSFFTDESVEIRGARVTHAGETALWARLVTKDGKTLILRDDDGTPRWPRASDEDPDGCGIQHAPVR